MPSVSLLTSTSLLRFPIHPCAFHIPTILSISTPTHTHTHFPYLLHYTSTPFHISQTPSISSLDTHIPPYTINLNPTHSRPSLLLPVHSHNPTSLPPPTFYSHISCVFLTPSMSPLYTQRLLSPSPNVFPTPSISPLRPPRPTDSPSKPEILRRAPGKDAAPPSEQREHFHPLLLHPAIDATKAIVFSRC